MPKVNAVVVLGDKRTRLCRQLGEWMDEVAKLRAKTLKCGRKHFKLDDLDNLRFNETTSVAFLAAAATSIGMFTLVEFCAAKRKSPQSKKSRAGRVDLWVGLKDGSRAWAIEAKQMWLNKKTSVAQIGSKADEAKLAARHLDMDEGDELLACLILCQDLDEKQCTETNEMKLCAHFENQDDHALIFRIDGGPCAVWIVWLVVTEREDVLS